MTSSRRERHPQASPAPVQKCGAFARHPTHVTEAPWQMRCAQTPDPELGDVQQRMRPSHQPLPRSLPIQPRWEPPPPPWCLPESQPCKSPSRAAAPPSSQTDPTDRVNRADELATLATPGRHPCQAKQWTYPIGPSLHDHLRPPPRHTSTIRSHRFGIHRPGIPPEAQKPQAPNEHRLQ